MKTQCCRPPYGSVQCPDCPLTVPMYRPDYNRGITAGGQTYEEADAATQSQAADPLDIKHE